MSAYRRARTNPAGTARQRAYSRYDNRVAGVAGEQAVR